MAVMQRSRHPFALSLSKGEQSSNTPFVLRRSSARTVALLLFFNLVFIPIALATVQQKVYITGHVQPFGGYKATEAVAFEVRQPGKQEIGRIVVDGLYNGEYPWILRAYTDNLQFSGVGGAVRSPSPAGVVSTDGQFAIPLFLNCPNFGPEEWQRIPDLGETQYSDCIVMGIDPRNGVWVAGPDGLLYTADDNLLGDITIETPFEIALQADVPSSAVRGRYDTTLYLEIVAAP